MNIPTIGASMPKCRFCETPYTTFIHPEAGEMYSLDCNCIRPVCLGDVKAFAEKLENEEFKALFNDFHSYLNQQAIRERNEGACFPGIKRK